METSLEKLRSDAVLTTVRRLEERIAGRFPDRGLRRVAGELRTCTEAVAESTATVRGRRSVLRPLSRAGIVAVLVVTATVLVLAVESAVVDAPATGLDWVPLLESAVNDLVFAGLAIWFLYSVPERIQREDLLEQLHRLRSLAHIVDMHQLAKGPEQLGPDGLEHYLEYCSELLSLVGKAAALCAEASRDQIVLDTVRSIETLTIGLDTTIRQKIAQIDAARQRAVEDAVAERGTRPDGDRSRP